MLQPSPVGWKSHQPPSSAPDQVWDDFLSRYPPHRTGVRAKWNGNSSEHIPSVYPVRNQWWALYDHDKIMSSTSLKFSRGFSLRWDKTHPLFRLSKPSMIRFHLPLLYPLPRVLHLQWPHTCSSNTSSWFLPRDFSTGSSPSRGCSSAFPRASPGLSDLRTASPNRQVAIHSPSLISPYLPFCRALISACYYARAFVGWPANSTKTKTLAGQGFACFSCLLSVSLVLGAH